MKNPELTPITRKEIEETAREFGLSVAEMKWMIGSLDNYCKMKNFPLKKLPHSAQLNWFIAGFVSAVAYRIHSERIQN